MDCQNSGHFPDKFKFQTKPKHQKRSCFGTFSDLKISRLCQENIEFLYHLRWIAKILDIFQTNSNSRQNPNIRNGHVLGHFLYLRWTISGQFWTIISYRDSYPRPPPNLIGPSSLLYICLSFMTLTK